MYEPACILHVQAAVHKHGMMRRHYALREPADDVELAKVLVRSVLGPTVPWPSEKVIQLPDAEFEQVVDSFAAEAMLTPIADAEPDALSDEDDEPLEYWPAGDLFGITESMMLAICDTDASSGPQSSSASSSHAASPVDGKKHKHEEMEKKNKKNKKDKSECESKKKGKKEAKGAAKKRPAEVSMRAIEEQHGVQGKRSRLEPASKAWIEREHDQVKPAGRVAERQWFEAALAKGLACGVLGDCTTAEGLRSHIRKRAAELSPVTKLHPAIID